MIKIYFDGSHRTVRREEVRWGFAVYDLENRLLYQGAGRDHLRGVRLDSMIAELVALEKAMAWAAAQYAKNKVEFFGDNQSVISLMRGESKAHSANYRPLYEALMEAKSKCPYWFFDWINRENNMIADALSQRGKQPGGNQGSRRWQG